MNWATEMVEDHIWNGHDGPDVSKYQRAGRVIGLIWQKAWEENHAELLEKAESLSAAHAEVGARLGLL